MIREYTHELNKEIRSISGGYQLEREETIDLDGKQVVYAVGNAMIDASCCGVWGCRYALVPGYVIRWKHRTTPDGDPVSDVQPIDDEQVRKRIIRLLEAKEAVNQVRFW